MPVATYENKGILSLSEYALIPKRLLIGSNHNAIYLGSYKKAWVRQFIFVYGYNPLNLYPLIYILSFSVPNTGNINIHAKSIGTKDDMYTFYYKDNGDTVSVYVYSTKAKELSTDHNLFIISDTAASSVTVNVDETYTKIPIE